jgi:hypothetical protein
VSTISPHAHLVPGAGLEPAPLSGMDFKSIMATITSPRHFYYKTLERDIRIELITRAWKAFVLPLN